MTISTRPFVRRPPAVAMTPEQKLANMRAFVEEKLTEIKGFFLDDMKVTFIARRPGFPEQDVLISSDDDVDAIIAAVERARSRTAT